MHVSVDEDLVRQLDAKVGPRGRSAFLERLIRHALEDEHRWELIMSAVGAIPDRGHDWDAGPATWVRDQRRSASDRIG